MKWYILEEGKEEVVYYRGGWGKGCMEEGK